MSSRPRSPSKKPRPVAPVARHRDRAAGGRKTRANKTSLGARIRLDLEGDILAGRLRPGDRIPSELELTQRYSCSRMTVSHALSDMATAGLLVRRRGAGSHVADPPAAHAILEIHDLEEEARRAQRSYRYQLLSANPEPPASARARSAGFAEDEALVRICIVHEIDDKPVAYEDRLISLRATPAAGYTDFSRIAPVKWLNENVPLSEAEHNVWAQNADSQISRLLKVAAGTACLMLQRRTWSLGQMVTCVIWTYLGSRVMSGRFSPSRMGQAAALSRGARQSD